MLIPVRGQRRSAKLLSRLTLATTLALSLAVLSVPLRASAEQTQKVGDPPEAKNMELVGYEPLQARAAYQPTIRHQGDRWIAYIGHHGGTDAVPTPLNSMTGSGAERHFNRRRHRSSPSEIPAPHSRPTRDA